MKNKQLLFSMITVVTRDMPGAMSAVGNRLGTSLCPPKIRKIHQNHHILRTTPEAFFIRPTIMAHPFLRWHWVFWLTGTSIGTLMVLCSMENSRKKLTSYQQSICKTIFRSTSRDFQFIVSAYGVIIIERQRPQRVHWYTSGDGIVHQNQSPF